MNKLIRHFALAFLLCGTLLPAWAQTSFVINAGVNYHNLIGENAGGTKLSHDYKIGIRAGAYAEIHLQQAFYLTPGLAFSIKGADNLNGVKDHNATVYYLEIPVQLTYKSSLTIGSILVGMGGYFAYAFSGNHKFAGGTEKITFTSNVSNPVGVPYMKPFDAGVDLMLGVEFPIGLRVAFNMQIGMINLEPKIENIRSKATMRNIGYALSLGYRF